LPHLGVRDTVPAPEDAPDSEIPLGLIGMDLLSGTVILIAARSSGRVLWYVPTKHLVATD